MEQTLRAIIYQRKKEYHFKRQELHRQRREQQLKKREKLEAVARDRGVPLGMCGPSFLWFDGFASDKGNRLSLGPSGNTRARKRFRRDSNPRPQ